jgi:hypothetical protein
LLDLTSFRQALADLQRQVDELDGIKAGYHEEVLEGEDEVSLDAPEGKAEKLIYKVWDNVLEKIAFVVRSQLDFYEKIAGKASDPILEPLVMSIPDPFDSYGPPKEEGQIFSVLAPCVPFLVSQIDTNKQTWNARFNTPITYSQPHQNRVFTSYIHP